MRPRLLSRALVLIAVCVGCGGSQAGKDIDAAFRRIQLHEARLNQADRAIAAAQREPSETLCPRACAAPGDARAASDGVCAEAAAIDEADARARCEQARARSAGMTAPGACPCGPNEARP